MSFSGFGLICVWVSLGFGRIGIGLVWNWVNCFLLIKLKLAPGPTSRPTSGSTNGSPPGSALGTALEPAHGLAPASMPEFGLSLSVFCLVSLSNFGNEWVLV